MSTGYERVSENPSPNSLPLAWQRLLALSGVVSAVLFVIGWFASGGDAPDYGASDQAWTDWADDNQWKSRIGAFAMLLAGFVLCTSHPRSGAPSRVTTIVIAALRSLRVSRSPVQ